MDKLISLCPLVIALIPIGMALRALLAELRPQTESPTAEFYRANSRPTKYPSLATLRDLEDTMPMFVRSGEWRGDEVKTNAAG
jgi:hypothetical protein